MPVAYNEYIKRPGIETEYTPNMIQELVRCKKDILHFLDYVKINTLDKGIQPYNPYPFQLDLLNLYQKNNRCVVLSSRQSGKCLFRDISIKIRNKINGEIEEITMEDFFNKMKK